MRHTHWVLAVVTAAGSGSSAAAVHAQPQEAVAQLSAIVDKAITTHPEIRARYQDFVSSLEGQSVSRGGLRPQVTAQTWVGREWRSHMADGASTDWNRPGWNIELRQLLFDGGALRNTTKQWGYEKLSKYYDLLATTNSLASDAVGAYLDVQRFREMVRLARENFNVHEVTLLQLRERQRSGVGRGVDLEQANGRLALAQVNLMTESNNLNEVVQRYRRIVGEAPAADLDTAPDITAHMGVDVAPDGFAAALRRNPTILSKRALILAAQAGVKAAKGTRSPTVEFRASTGRDRSQPTSDARNLQSSQVQVLLSYNLFRGGADEARIRQTSAQTYAARDVEDYTCRNIQQSLAINWTGIQRLREQMPFLGEHEMSTSKVRVAYQQQFQIGQRTLLDMLNTENELFDARRSLANAQFDLKKLEFQWLMLSSTLLEALGLVQPHNADAPEEQQSLVLPDEVLRTCMAPVPDTRNLAPVLAYGEGDKPPVLQIPKTPTPEATGSGVSGREESTNE